ncbi:MAG: hypothetical protein ACR2LZ_07600 [Pyrinomonadaceae bacterium]
MFRALFDWTFGWERGHPARQRAVRRVKLFALARSWQAGRLRSQPYTFAN